MEIPIELCESCKAYKKDPVKKYFFVALLVALYSFSGKSVSRTEILIVTLVVLYFYTINTREFLLSLTNLSHNAQLQCHSAIILRENLGKQRY